MLTPKDSFNALRRMTRWLSYTVGTCVTVCAAIFLGLTVEISQKERSWTLGLGELKLAIVISISFAAMALFAFALRGRIRKFGTLRVGAVLLVLWPSILFIIVTRANSLGSPLIAAAAAAATVLCALPLVYLPNWWASTASLILAGALTIVVLRERDSWFVIPSSKIDFSLETSLYTVSVRGINENYPQRSSGGGFTSIGDALVIATADGTLRVTRVNRSSFSTVAEVKDAVPMNRSVFARVWPGPHTQWFRVLDIESRQEGERYRLLLSFHHYDSDRNCTVLRVVQKFVHEATLIDELRDGRWATLYETTPCIPSARSEPEWPFRGMEGGGRIGFLDDSSILLTVGDHGFNGVDFEQEVDLVNDPKADYGKVVRILLSDGSREVFTTGHRNQQGLWISPSGNVWTTEHGPQGGDELNRLRRGNHYGWPNVSYGTDYSTKVWPRNDQQGQHEGFAKPIFAWIPSVGLSNLIELSGSTFPLWKGDLLVSSLVGRRIFRVRLEEDRVVFVEPLDIGHPIRDILEHPSGGILLLGSDYRIESLNPTTSVMSACSGCHNLATPVSGRLGPHLVGIVGRRAAALTDFTYSESLKTRRNHWTPAELDRFLAAPQKHVPGTSMNFQGIADPVTRAEVIAYLQKGQK